MAACSWRRGSTTARATANGKNRATSASEAAAIKHTSAAHVRPGQERGLHSSAQKVAKKNHHGTLTTLLRSSTLATGRRTMPAANKARKPGEAICPLAIWKTRPARHPRLRAPVIAKRSDTSRQRDEASQLDREAGEQLHVTVVQCGQCGPEGHCPRLGIENTAVFGPDRPGGGQARLAQQCRDSDGSNPAQITKGQEPGRQAAPGGDGEQ